MMGFVVHNSIRLPNGLILITGVVDGKRLCVGQFGRAKLATGMVELEIVSVAMTSEEDIKSSIQGIVTRLKVGEYSPMQQVVLEFV